MTEKKTRGFSPPILGETYPATIKGFQHFLVRANEADAIGYDLVTLVRLEKKLAAVWRRRSNAPREGGYDSFVGDDDVDPIPTYR